MLLINPKANRKQLLGALAPYVPLNVPFGISFLAGYLLKNWKNVFVLDLDLDYVRFNNATPYPGTELYDIKLISEVVYKIFRMIIYSIQTKLS